MRVAKPELAICPQCAHYDQLYVLPFHVFVEIFMFLSGFPDALTYNFRHHFYFYDYLAVRTGEFILFALYRHWS
jgi:hypothetical membrane protein